MTAELSADEARRIALVAQGFGRPHPARVTKKQVKDVVKRLHALQIDSVNVLVRSHYLPVFSRLGQYPMSLLDRLVNDHELIETNAHQASIVPVELEPLFRPGIEALRNKYSGWRHRLESKRPGYIDQVHKEVASKGPIALKHLADPGEVKKASSSEVTVRRRDGKPYADSSLLWWRSSDGKDALEGLELEGRLALAGRGPTFERFYDLKERVIPAEVLSLPTPSESEALRELIRLAAKALGVATVKDLANYFSLKVTGTRAAVNELLESGELVPTTVEGWKDPAFFFKGAALANSVEGRALLSPFDSLTWSRDRTKRLFGFDFSFEIYVPEPKRRFGYYVLPFLMGESLVARVDVKADRQAGKLLVQGAYAEDSVKKPEVASELASALVEMAAWLELDGIRVADRGDLSAALRRSVASRRR